MQTITYDPATHVLVPREPTEGMLQALHTAAYLWRNHSWREAEKCRWETGIKAAPMPPQSSCTEIPNNYREAMLWNAAALQAVCADVVMESSTVSIHDAKKTFCEILDMADAALSTEKQG